ncbi:MAG: SIMPL domain-containing protein [Caulobacter sp.]|nr:SIMPL domain-containing protein [Caulobacter sp.]
MRHALIALALIPAALSPSLSFAQTAPGPVVDRRYDPEPWWMREPVITSMGLVRTEVPANRGNFRASFQSVERTAPEATKAAADQVRALGKQLAAVGADRVRIESSFSITPLYDQYRDREGNLINNERADKIEKYQVNATLSIEVRDMTILEQVYAMVVAAQPTSVGAVNFSLQETNETKAYMYAEAIKDAARRARIAADAAGARLGGVKVIDPSGRACQTDILARQTYGSDDGSAAYDVAPPPPPAMASRYATAEMARAPQPATGVSPEDMRLPLQPPLHELNGQACVVYGLN